MPIFKDISEVERKVKVETDRRLLENLHFALYGKTSQGKSTKRGILSFSGYTFEENSDEYKKHHDLISKSLSVNDLTQLCEFFASHIINEGNATDLTKIFFKTVMLKFNQVQEESHRSNQSNQASKRSGSTRIYSVKSKSLLTTSSKHSNIKSKIFNIQNEISKMQDEYLSKQEEIVILEFEIEDLKNSETAQIQDITKKENELSKRLKLLKLWEERIKNKEQLITKFLEFDDTSSKEVSSCDESNIEVAEIPINATKNIEEWLSENESQNKIENLTKSINSMLARQTIGQQFIKFDGTSCLKWPIFYSQYKLSNEKCGYSPVENVLRLNNCLTGEAKKSVEMLLVTAKNPDQILDILQQKYGRPEIIMEELLMKTKDLENIETMESFMEFSCTVRNLAAVVVDDMVKFVDERHLLATLVNKLPPHLFTQWGSYLIEKNISLHKESLQHFSNWIQQISEVVSRVTFVSKTSNTNQQPVDIPVKTKDYLPKESYHPGEKICKVCKESGHPIGNCNAFKHVNVKERWKIVQKYNLCYCCLRLHHGKCKRRKACGINNCDRFHNNLLHKNIETVAHITESHGNTLLKILPMRAVQQHIDSDIVEKLGLSGPNAPFCCKWTGDIYHYEPESQILQAEVAGKFNTAFYPLKDIRTVKNLQLPKQYYDWDNLCKQFPFIEQVKNYLQNTEPPKLLIGQNNAHLIVSRQIIQPYPTTPILSKTKLGWTLHGIVGNSLAKNNLGESTFMCCEVADEKLHELVKDFMKLENFGVAVTKLNKFKIQQEDRALQIAKESIRNIGGRYEVKLPWKQEKFNFPDSRAMAMQRLFCLERKLLGNQQLATLYLAETQKLFEKYAVLVKPEELENAKRIWYLPHFPVMNPNKPNKIRIVFDAAAKINALSLNDFLLTGPDWLTSIFGVLLRFRTHKFAFAGDIKEMFNRVRISDEDNFSQCFLWRDLQTNILPRIYRMTAMLFGTTCSPFLAQFVKNYNAEKYKTEYERASQAITHNHYVDDYLDGTDTVEEACQLVNEVIFIHGQGGFEIRNFSSNCQEILNSIPEQLRGKDINLIEVDKTKTEKILGMNWNPGKDCFNFKIKMLKITKDILNGNKIPTKREVLKTAMSIYDPIGLLSPVTIKAKILLQTIWRADIGWDDFITDKMFEKWNMWLKELKVAMDIEIPRHYSDNFQKTENIELHVFSDASEDAYSTVVYLRLQSHDRIEMVLIASKARVAPLKTLTIPKLELLAAVMGVRLYSEIIKHVKLNISKKYFWSDSRTVLKWLSTDKKLQTFVAARVGEILDVTELKEWRWVSTKDNVADDCTRCSPRMLSSYKNRWFLGPDFLYQSKHNWPKLPENDIDEDTDVSKEHVLFVTECASECLPEIKDHYTWIKLLRITARIKRFITNCRKKMQDRGTNTFISLEEIEWSQKMWWKHVQSACFAKDLENLQKKQTNKNGRLHHVSLFLDSENVMRVSSRILRIDDVSILQKEPVVLDGNHPFCQKIIAHFHKKYGHQGVETIVNELKRSYWIPRLRPIVKKVTRQCSQCRRNLATQVQPKMGLLPGERLLKYEKPFTATGIDYFGPYYVKIGRRIEKRYGVLFTCLTIRAVHVELAHSLNTDSCILAIRRFLARRGNVKVVWSDNGTNFHGANRELLEALEDLKINKVAEEIVVRGIDWKFNPPLAPHMGGSWERLIGCFKRALTAVLKERHPTEEVLQTIFCEVEHILNSRPLTHVSNDCHDIISICPNDILIGNSETLLVPGSFSERDLVMRKQWRIAQYLTDLFWKRWLREYLPTLIDRKKWIENEPNIKKGELVVINDNNLPRGDWPIGIVEKIYEGDDQVVRVADIRTARGVYRRPVRKLYRLNNCANREVSTGGQDVK